MFVAVLALVAASAAPTTTTAVPAPATNAAPAVKERKICRIDDAVIGSITPKRVCKTKAEWDAAMDRIPVGQKIEITTRKGTGVRGVFVSATGRGLSYAKSPASGRSRGQILASYVSPIHRAACAAE